MSWCRASLVACLVVACSSTPMKVKKGEPQTAREKMLAEERANPSTGDDTPPPGSKKWTGWRYQGEREECFFLVGRKCFKTEKAACQAASCEAPATCMTEGAGPATITCSGERVQAPVEKKQKQPAAAKSKKKKG
jgi:hypothetical protein